MVSNRCRFGELCLQVRLADNAVPVTTVSPGVTNGRVMSGTCDFCRFGRHVQFTDTCWLWTGTRYMQFGQPTYGQSSLNGRRMGAHRVAHLLWNGPIPQGMDVLHSCDVKACVNPAHLRVGTHTENIREAFAKLPDDFFSGERNGNARLTWTDVRAMRAAAARGETQASIAKRYAVTPAHVSQIVRGLKWPEPQHEEKVA